MERKTSILILSALLLAGFFVPSIQWEDFTLSGFDFVVSSHTPDIKYILLVIPACALCLLAGALIDDVSITFNKYLLRIPLIALILLFILLFSNADYRTALGSNNPFKIFSLGLWIVLGISVILPGFRKKESNSYRQSFI